MQNYNQMPMPPLPGAGRNYGPSSSAYGPTSSYAPTSSYGPNTSSYGPTSFQQNQYGGAPAPYGNTGYSVQTQGPSQDSFMDTEMKSLIEQLKSSIGHGSAEELDSLLKNEDKLNGLIEGTPQVEALKKKRNELILSNKEQATMNLSMQPEFESLKERLSEAVLLQSSKKEEYDILKSRLESTAGNFSLDTTLAILQTSAAEKDSASEALANELLDCKLPIEEFLEQYIGERTVYHLRKIKADKMAEIVRRGPPNQQQGYGSGYGRF